MLGLFSKQNIAKTIAPLLLVVGLCFTLATATAIPASAQDPPGNPVPSAEDTGQTGGVNEDEEVTCAIEKLGWVLCPVIEQAGDIGDKAFQMLASNFLETEPELVAATTGGRPSGTYVAWEMARNIANVMFVIAFLIIIYSQVTGAGLNNYGIKKLLPRLIIAVIAVNVSYYICQAMVDLTNILGYTIKDFLVQISTTISDKSAMPIASAEGSISQTGQSGPLKAIALGVLGLAGVVWLILPMLGVSVAAILIACLAIIVILMMRKAFIVLLVVLSPIAFVLYLLPNTERLFKKWASMFWQLLMVFPVVALLFGGGQIASAIVLIAGTQVNSSTTAGPSNSIYKDSSGKCIQLPSSTSGPAGNGPASVGTCGTGSTPFMLGLTAALIAVAPLFAVWSVLKGALSAAGAIGGKIGGQIQTIGDKAGRGANKAEDWAKKAAIKNATTAAYGNKYTRPFVATGRRFKRRGELADAKLAAAQAKYDSEGGLDLSNDIAGAKGAAAVANMAANQKFTEALANNSAAMGKFLGNPGAGTMLGNALETQQTKAKAEAQKDIEARLDPADLDGLARQLKDAIVSGNILEARAISSALLKSGGAGQTRFHSAIGAGASAAAAAGTDTTEMAKELQRNILGGHPGMKGQDYAIGKWAEESNASLAQLGTMQNSSGTYSSMTASQFASQSKESQNKIFNTLGAGHAQIADLKVQLQASPNALATIDNGLRTKMGI